ncbi:MAG: hypothetical protein AAFO83_00135 [Cyanobacteria bacterium J06607_13]
MTKDLSREWADRELYADRIPVCSTNVVRMANESGDEGLFWVDLMLSGLAVSHAAGLCRREHRSPNDMVEEVNGLIKEFLSQPGATLSPGSFDRCHFMIAPRTAVNQTTLVELTSPQYPGYRASVQAFQLKHPVDASKTYQIWGSFFRPGGPVNLSLLATADNPDSAIRRTLGGISMYLNCGCDLEVTNRSPESCSWLDPDLEEQTWSVVVRVTTKVTLRHADRIGPCIIQAAQLSSGRLAAYNGRRHISYSCCVDTPGEAIAKTILYIRERLDCGWEIDGNSDRYCRWRDERLNRESQQELETALRQVEQLDRTKPRSVYTTWL